MVILGSSFNGSRRKSLHPVAGRLMTEADHPPISHSSDPNHDHPPVSHSSDSNHDHPPIPHLSDPNHAHPPVSHSSDSNHAHPPIPHLSDPNHALPPVSHSSDSNHAHALIPRDSNAPALPAQANYARACLCARLCTWAGTRTNAKKYTHIRAQEVLTRAAHPPA